MTIVRWIHPSYRDLVIDELAADSALRGRFLEAINLEGIKLCVSQAGGSRGDRRLPLLVSEADWRALAQRCLRFLSLATSADAVSLIKVLRSASVDTEGHERTRLVSLLSRCYDAVREKWDASQAAINQEELKELFEAGVLVDPLPVAPRLGPTWTAAVIAFRDALTDSSEKSVTLDAKVVAEWATLAELLMNNEPRFMRQTSFPKSFVGDVTQLLVIAESEAQTEDIPEDVDDIWSEADRMSTLTEALVSIGKLFPGLADRISDVKAKTAAQEDFLRDAYKESSPEDDEDYDPEASREKSHEAFDVEGLFRDL